MRERIRRMTIEFASHLEDQGLGHIAEWADGEPPYRPGGRTASVLSCAAVLDMIHLATAP